MQIKFKQIHKDAPDIFGYDMPLSFKRYSMHKRKYIITVITYGKCLYRSIVNEVNTVSAWQSPLFTTFYEALNVSLTFVSNRVMRGDKK